jgi:branched-chain amino acid transport system permease protein
MYNLAHGSLVAIGAYTAFWLSVAYPSPIVFVASILTTTIAALVVAKGVYIPLRGRGVDRNGLLVVSFGVLLIVQTSLLILAGVNKLYIGGNQIPTVKLFSFGGFDITNLFLWSLIGAACVGLTLLYLYKRTRIGKTFSAVADNEALARLSGINVARATTLAWLVTGAITGLSGGFLSMYSVASPNVGSDVAIIAYAGAAFGGLTNFRGAIIGTFIVAFAQNLLINFLGATFDINVAYEPVIVLGVVVVLLLVQFGRYRIGHSL